MPATYVNKGTFASGNNAISPGIPSGYTVGNFLLLLVESANEAIATPSGWTEVSSSPQSYGTAAAAGGVRLGVFWRIATSGQTAPSIPDTGNHTTGIIFEFSGVHQTEPIKLQAGQSNAAASAAYFPAFVTDKPNRVIVLCLANDRDIASTTNLSSWYNTTLASIVQRHDQTVATGVGGGIGMATAVKTTAGNFNLTSVNLGATVTSACITLALKNIEESETIITPRSTVTGVLRSKGALKAVIHTGEITTTFVKLGFHYNGHVVTDSRNIANTGWHIASYSDFENLILYIEPTGTVHANTVAPKLREPGSQWWDNFVSTNDYGFNGRGAGNKYPPTSYWMNLKYTAFFRSGTIWDYDWHHVFVLNTNGSVPPDSIYANAFIPNFAASFRLVKDSTTLSHGQSGTYKGNDGKIYRTICINDLEWLADNLCETKWRNGESLTLITDSTTWDNATGPAYCAYDWNTANALTAAITPSSINLRLIARIKATISSGNLIGTNKIVAFGALYNRYAACDSRNIANTGWHLPSLAEWSTLITYAGGTTVAGKKLKEIGTLYWQSPNTGTNEYGFNLRGGSYRDADTGAFLNFHTANYLWASNDFATDYGTIVQGSNSIDNFQYTGGGFNKGHGISVRLLKDSTSLTHGEKSTYTGNDGTVYDTICIGTQEWLSASLVETKFRNGDWIPGYDNGVYTAFSDAAWAALDTSGMCYLEDSVAHAYYYADNSTIATLKMQSSVAELVSAILNQSGITATLTGTARLQANADGSTTLFAQVIDAGGTQFIPVITFF